MKKPTFWRYIIFLGLSIFCVLLGIKAKNINVVGVEIETPSRYQYTTYGFPFQMVHETGKFPDINWYKFNLAEDKLIIPNIVLSIMLYFILFELIFRGLTFKYETPKQYFKYRKRILLLLFLALGITFLSLNVEMFSNSRINDFEVALEWGAPFPFVMDDCSTSDTISHCYKLFISPLLGDRVNNGAMIANVIFYYLFLEMLVPFGMLKNKKVISLNS